jgi:hypothetical protein
MPVTKKKIQWITKRDMDSLVDRRARAVLKVSGKTFIRNRNRGDYVKLDADQCPGIVELALLAPSDRVATPRARKNR